MNPVAPVTKYDMAGRLPAGHLRGQGHGVTRCVTAGHRSDGLSRDLPPPNMISSQLGTEARPRVFLTGRRGGSGLGSSAGPRLVGVGGLGGARGARPGRAARGRGREPRRRPRRAAVGGSSTGARSRSLGRERLGAGPR